jgi:hypothetical protein
MKKEITDEVEKLLKSVLEARGEPEEVKGYELIKYADFNQMMYAMQTYVATTGNKLEIRDDPYRMRLGFVDEPNKRWFIIRIVDVKRSREAMTPEHQEVFKRALQSEDGKLNLLAVINKYKVG